MRSIRSFAMACIFLLLASTRTTLGQTSIPTEEEIGSVQVLESEDAALAEIFPDADSAIANNVGVDLAMHLWLRQRLGWAITDSAYVCFDVYRAGEQLGFAVVADEQGKYRPITFMAGIDTSLRIVDVRVLVYRESRGGEVRHTRFLKQYRGKSLDNAIRINRDIVNITGATVSVNALNAGVRKALAVAEYLHQSRGGAQ